MVRTLEDLYSVCANDALRVMPAQVALAHFDLLDLAFGSKWRGVAANQSALENLMPEHATDEDQVVVSIGGIRLYRSCRSTISKLIMSLVWSENTDTFRLLRILGAEAQLGSGLSDLKVPLERAFGIGVNPSEITRKIAIDADAPLSGMDRQRLRRAFATLDKLRLSPKISERRLLGTEPIGKMPKYWRDGQPGAQLPPQLEVFCSNLNQNIRSSVQAVYRAALAERIVEVDYDIAPTRLIESANLEKIGGRLRESVSDRTAKVYLNRVIKAVLDHEPSARHPDSWEELKRAAARAGFAAPLDPLHFLKTRCEGCAPQQVSQKRYDGVLKSEDLACNRARLRSAGKLLNELRMLQNEELQPLLPAVDLFIPQRKKKIVSEPAYLPPEPWNDLIKVAKIQGLSRDKLHAIGAVKQKASKKGLSPREITRAWACDALERTKARTSRGRFRRGIEFLDALRAIGTNADLLPISDLGPLPNSRQRGNPKLPERLSREIKNHAEFRGLSPNTTRSILTSITIVFSKAKKKEMFELPLAEIPLVEIVDEISSCASDLPKRWQSIFATARQLEMETSFVWRDDWADLQRRVVAAGVAVKENPVPYVAAVAQAYSLSPKQMTSEWSDQYAQSLRPDLRVTWNKRFTKCWMLTFDLQV